MRKRGGHAAGQREGRGRDLEDKLFKNATAEDTQRGRAPGLQRS